MRLAVLVWLLFLGLLLVAVAQYAMKHEWGTMAIYLVAVVLALVVLAREQSSVR